MLITARGATMESYLGAIACVVGLSAGQILFKVSAGRLAETKTVFDPGFLGVLCIALALYGVVSIAWVLLLQRSQLSQIYPIMALSFLFVPLASAYFFKEPLNWQYGLGVILIIAGVVIASLAQSQKA